MTVLTGMYIQPIAGGKSMESRELKKCAVVARAHVASPQTSLRAEDTALGLSNG